MAVTGSSWAIGVIETPMADAAKNPVPAAPPQAYSPLEPGPLRSSSRTMPPSACATLPGG